MKRILVTFAGILLLTSCSKTAKHTLGLTEDMPDELQVRKVKPLEVPPHFNHSTLPATSAKAIKKANKLSKAEEAVLKEAEAQ